MKNQHGKSLILFVAIAIIALIVGLYVQQLKKNTEQIQVSNSNYQTLRILDTQRDLYAATFTDHKGDTFSVDDFKGKWSILFFGFTHCPDICPTTMHTLKQVKEKVAEAGYADNYQVYMVSVDPERDTTERLNSYVPFFDPSFIGLRTSLEEVTQFAKKAMTVFIKGKVDETNGSYDVDHGAALILLNPEGKFVGVMSAPHTVDEISSDLIVLAKETGKLTPSTASTIDSHSTANEAENNNQTLDNTQSQALAISKAWIRPAPPTARAMAGYFELSNTGDSDIVLIDVESPLFRMSMIHETVVEDGVASMEHLDQLVVPAGGKAVLKPMGTHLMLMNPPSPVEPGAKVPVTLKAENGETFEFTIEVREEPQ